MDHGGMRSCPLPHCMMVKSVHLQAMNQDISSLVPKAIHCMLRCFAVTLATRNSSSSSGLALSLPFAMGKSHKKKHHKHRPELASCAASYIAQWASLRKRSDLSVALMNSSSSLHDWIPGDASLLSSKAPVIELHTHSTCSDGMLSPNQLVEKAAASGVQVLALTDHDTMAGVPAALETANKFGIRLIPGVEISAKVTAKTKNGFEEPVHILGYYSCCGPTRWLELETVLARIREGRHHRAQNMISKLKLLKKPVTWESVVTMAGDGVAPGRLHIARALLEAGHVCNLREAFNKYLYDGGPAYSPGCELAAEDAVRLIRDTGGVAALAHPWSLKDALPVVKRLKEVGLHAMEVYRGDGKANGFVALADTFQLLKLGGSDFHGRGDPDETKLGKVPLPLLAIREFLRVAEPIWIASIEELLQNFAEESFQVHAGNAVGSKFFTELEGLKGDIALEYSIEEEHSRAFLRLSAWLTDEDRQAVHNAVMQLKLGFEVVSEDGRTTCIVSRQLH
ncbi:hypothetical protein GOP47_0017489 [Adiantum capillus-veneris]|uniref:Polymerase/histidinol phosphatase N-terminal domain-containing protein n=1 Tax=Adiantum capillus-veneris TaxID=13818 RepID=A0A9D4UGN3_ADICA|nr:hypothetical protein GOP47_0017489 [Adiantum capillus-veneris]